MKTPRPRKYANHFICPFCYVDSTMKWSTSLEPAFFNLIAGTCDHCKRTMYFLHDDLIFPASYAPVAPRPALPTKVKQKYIEAGELVLINPRAACGTLRIALEYLLEDLGCEGKSLNDNIAYLISRGVNLTTKQALDILRVLGNHASHKSEMKYKTEDANQLFYFINMVAETMISTPKAIQKLHNNLPDTAKLQIKSRDKKALQDIDKTKNHDMMSL